METVIQKKSNIFFVPNKGRYDKNVLFYSHAYKTHYFFLKDKISAALCYDEDKALSLVISFLNSNTTDVEGKDKKQTTFNYFKGKDQSKWISNLPTFSRIEYKNVWEDIDLSVSHEEKCLKMNWTVRPNANLENIRLQYEGVDSIEIDEVGNLIIKHEFGEIKDNAPVSYQAVNGSRVDINCKFKIFSDMTVGFEIEENYNPSYDLVKTRFCHIHPILGAMHLILLKK